MPPSSFRREAKIAKAAVGSLKWCKTPAMKVGWQPTDEKSSSPTIAVDQVKKSKIEAGQILNSVMDLNGRWKI